MKAVAKYEDEVPKEFGITGAAAKTHLGTSPHYAHFQEALSDISMFSVVQAATAHMRT